jgi:hypothetical protein
VGNAIRRLFGRRIFYQVMVVKPEVDIKVVLRGILLFADAPDLSTHPDYVCTDHCSRVVE